MSPYVCRPKNVPPQTEVPPTRFGRLMLFDRAETFEIADNEFGALSTASSDSWTCGSIVSWTIDHRPCPCGASALYSRYLTRTSEIVPERVPASYVCDPECTWSKRIRSAANTQSPITSLQSERVVLATLPRTTDVVCERHSSAASM